MVKPLIIIFGVIALASGCKTGVPVMGDSTSRYQQDMDTIRMRDMQKIAGWIEKYRYLTGYYPLVKNSPVPQYVYIATQDQKNQIIQITPTRHVTTPYKTLERALREVLKEDIRLPTDPQKVAVHKPNYYLYVTQGTHFWLTVYLYNPCSLSKSVGRHFNTLQISSKPLPSQKIWSPEILTMDKDFVKAANRPISHDLQKISSP